MGHRQQYSAIGIGRAAIAYNITRKVCFLSLDTCNNNVDVAKCVSKFLGIMTNIRNEIDMGLNSDDLNLYIKFNKI